METTGQILHLKSLNDFNNIKDDCKLIIKVGADWCVPCKKITPLYTQFAENNNNPNYDSVNNAIIEAIGETINLFNHPVFKRFTTYKEQLKELNSPNIDDLILDKLLKEFGQEFDMDYFKSLFYLSIDTLICSCGGV